MGYVNNGMGRWRAVVVLLLYLNDLLNLMKICKKKFFFKKKTRMFQLFPLKILFHPWNSTVYRRQRRSIVF